MDELLCEVRFAEDDTRQSPGILRGVLMPYGVKAQDRQEMFELGALVWPEDGILVRRMHDRKSPLVKVIPYMDGTDLRIDSPLLNSTAGRDAAVEMRNGVLTGLSVEFSATKETRRGGLRVIQSAILGGAGLVDYPSYAGAKAELRGKSDAQQRIARLWL